MSYIQISKLLPLSQQKVFAALSHPEELKRAWAGEVQVEILNEEKHYRKGSEILFRMTRFGISQPLCMKVEELHSPSHMTIKQVEGPFRFWIHKIKLEAHSEEATLVTESINYALPFGLFGHLADDLFIRADLHRLLELHLDRLAENAEAL